MAENAWSRRRFLAACGVTSLTACTARAAENVPTTPPTTPFPASAAEVWNWEDPAQSGRLDESLWTAMNYGGNRDLREQHVNDPAMVEIDQGRLILHAQPHPRDGYLFVAGGVTSKGKKALGPYGRLRTRQLLGPGVGLGIGVCLYGTEIDAVGWPACGEIDATEIALARPQSPFASVHGPGYSGGSPISTTGNFPSLVDRWAEHELIWEPGRLTWKIDGVPYHVAEASDPRASGGWPFDSPFFVTVVMTVGSYLSGPVDLNSWPRHAGEPRAYAVFEPLSFEPLGSAPAERLRLIATVDTDPDVWSAPVAAFQPDGSSSGAASRMEHSSPWRSCHAQAPF